MLINSKNNAYYGKIKNPIRVMLKVLCGKFPPLFVTGYDFSNLTEKQIEELQDWCSYNAKPYWNTGIGIMDAAEAMVEEAVGNANIQEK